MLSLRRLALAVSFVLIFLCTLYYFPSGRDLARQRLATALAHGSAALAPADHNAAVVVAPADADAVAAGEQLLSAARVELVVSSVVADNTSWITDNFPHYPAHIYVADDPYAPLTVKHNIGHESAVYLTYIIDNYDNLPDVAIFLHGRRYQWHNEDPMYDGVPVLQRLRIAYVQSHGFATLRCSWLLGCPQEMVPDVNATARWDDPTADQRLKTEAAYALAFTELFPGVPVPAAVGTHCGGQFAATRARIRARTRAEYEAYRRWLWSTALSDEFSGRVMEYSWHQILGQPAVDCPHAGACFCAKFGLCGLECAEHGCRDRYFFKFGELPARWPDEGPGTDGWPARDWYLPHQQQQQQPGRGKAARALL